MATARTRPEPRSAIISLGKVIIALYVMTLLAAFISARILPENGGGQLGVPAPEPASTSSSTAHP